MMFSKFFSILVYTCVQKYKERTKSDAEEKNEGSFQNVAPYREAVSTCR